MNRCWLILIGLFFLTNNYAQTTSYNIISVTEILKGARELYQNCESYQDRGAVRIYEILNDSAESPPSTQPQVTLFTTAVDGTRKFRYETLQRAGEHITFNSVLAFDGSTLKKQISGGLTKNKTPSALEQMYTESFIYHGKPLNPVFEFFAENKPLFPDNFTDAFYPLFEGTEQIGSSACYKVSLPDYRGNPKLQTYWFRKKDFSIAKIQHESETSEAYRQVTILFMPTISDKILPNDLAFDAPSSIFFEAATAYLDFGPAKRSSQFVSMRDLVEKPSPPNVQQAEITDDAFPAWPEEDELNSNATVNDNAFSASIVRINGKNRSANGFFCNIRNKIFIVTDQHLLFNNPNIRVPKLDVESDYQVSQIFGAAQRDIALIEVFERPESLIAVKSLEPSYIGNSVLLVKRTSTNQVETAEAKIKAITKTNIVLDTAITQSFQGSPILDVKSNEVIGIVSYERKQPTTTNVFVKKKPSAPRRWVGIRLDNIQNWERLNLANWIQQSQLIKTFHQNTQYFQQFADGETLKSTNNKDINQAIANYRNAIKQSNRTNDFHEREARLFLQQLVNISKQEIREYKEKIFYRYFKNNSDFNNNLTQQLTIREKQFDLIFAQARKWRTLKRNYK